jgi:hypothetical protein
LRPFAVSWQAIAAAINDRIMVIFKNFIMIRIRSVKSPIDE